MNSVKTGKIYGINGPVIYLKGRSEFKIRYTYLTRKEDVLLCLSHNTISSSNNELELAKSKLKVTRLQASSLLSQ